MSGVIEASRVKQVFQHRADRRRCRDPMQANDAATGVGRRGPRNFARFVKYLFVPSALHPYKPTPLFLTAFATITGMDIFKHGFTSRR